MDDPSISSILSGPKTEVSHFRLKENAKGLLRDIESEIESCIADGDCIADVRIDKDHGRLERRECFVTTKAPTLSDPSWEGIAQIAKVVRQATEISTGKVSNQSVYYISSTVLTASDFADCVKKHWQIESHHFILDERMERTDAPHARVMPARIAHCCASLFTT